MPLVGRDGEVAELEAAVAAAAAGNGACWLFLGEPGIGKSRLTEEACALARQAGFRTAWGRCWEAGGAPSFWPWVQVIRTLLRTREGSPLEQLGPYRRDLLAHLLPELGPSETDDAGHARFELMAGVTAWLCEIAEERPVWIGIEDLHVADPSSLALLDALVRPVADARVLFVGTARDAEIPRTGAGEAFHRVARDATVRALPRLDRSQVHTFLSQALPTEAQGEQDRGSRPLDAAVYEATEGNPLFLVELTRLLATTGAEADPRQLVPPSVRTTILRRRARLSEEAQELLSYAALAGREFRPEALQQAFGLAQGAPALQEVADAGLATPAEAGVWRFSHIVIPEVLLDALPAEEAARRHGSWAGYLSRRGAPCAEVARHFRSAGPQWRPQAFEASLQAGERASARLAFDDALGHFEVAHTLLDDAKVAAHIRLARAEGLARLAVGQADAGRALCQQAFELAVSAGDAVQMGESALAFGAVLRFAHVDDELVDMLRRALDALPTEDSEVRARCTARLAAALQPAPDPKEPIAMAHDAVAMARRVGDPDTLMVVLRDGCSALVDLSPADTHTPLSAELLALAEARGHYADAVRARLRLVFGKLELGQADEAWAHVDASVAHTREHAGPRHQWRVDALLGMRALWEGRYAEARGHIDRLREHDGNGNVANVELLQRAALCRATGDRDTLLRLAPKVAALFAGTEEGRMMATVYHAHLLIALDRVQEAAERLPDELAHAALDYGDCTLPFLVARFAAATSNRALAQRVIQIYPDDSPGLLHLGVLSMTLVGPVQRALAWAHEALGDAERAERHHRRADQVVRDSGGVVAGQARPARPSPASTMADTSAVLEREGDVWRLVFAGAEARVKATKGVAILARLLDKPGQDVHVLDLVHPDGGRAKVDPSDAGEVLDAEAREAYRARAADLQEQLAEAEDFHDLGRVARLQEELQALTDELMRGVGLGGRSRRTGSAAERARVNVRKRIRDAVSRIDAVHPALGRHLSRSVKTGLLCRYDP